MTDTELPRFNYSVMNKPAGKRSFYGDVTSPQVDLDASQRMGYLLDYISFLKQAQESVGIDIENATITACGIVFKGLRSFQEEYGDKSSHSYIVALDTYIKDTHRLDPKSQFENNSDIYVASFYTSLRGMVDVPQGA